MFWWAEADFEVLCGQTLHTNFGDKKGGDGSSGGGAG